MQLLPDNTTLGRLIRAPIPFRTHAFKRMEKHSCIEESVCRLVS